VEVIEHMTNEVISGVQLTTFTDFELDMIIFIISNASPLTRLADLRPKNKEDLKAKLKREADRFRTRREQLNEDLSNLREVALLLGWQVSWDWAAKPKAAAKAGLAAAPDAQMHAFLQHAIAMARPQHAIAAAPLSDLQAPQMPRQVSLDWFSSWHLFAVHLLNLIFGGGVDFRDLDSDQKANGALTWRQCIITILI
jgi:hypothetical protein